MTTPLFGKITVNKFILSEKLKIILIVLISKAFLIMLFLIFLSSLFGFWFFYKYVIIPEPKKQNVLSETLKFEQTAYQEVLWFREAGKSAVLSVKEESLPNPFIYEYEKNLTEE